MNISLQLYSIAKAVGDDFQGAVKRVAEMGYDGVEFAGYYDLGAEEMKQLLAENSLYTVSSHCGGAAFDEDLAQTLAYNKALGSNYVILPWAKLEDKKDAEKVVSLLNRASELAKGYGLKVGYHNHNQEFNKIGGQYILDYIAEHTNDDVVLQLDVYWAAYAGVDPFAYIEKMGKKIELIHLKQIGAGKKNVALPEGDIDMEKVIRTAKYATEFTVEQEPESREETAAIWDILKKNIEYLKGLAL